MSSNADEQAVGREDAVTLARSMADFAFSLTPDAIDPPIVVAARRHLADSVACALGAYDTEAVQIVRRFARDRGGRPDATLLGTGHRTPAGLAALVNGTMVRYLDANDIFASSRGSDSGHFSDGTPALLAVAEAYRSSGTELLTCLVAAYELLGAIAESFHIMNRGFHALSQVPWAIPIVLVRLMGGTPGQAVHASGLAGATGMVLNTWLKPSHGIPMIKGVAVGLAAQRAVDAAELAMLGVSASDDALETAFSRLGPLAEPPARLTRFRELGTRWTSTRNIIKAYPAQIFTQAAIQATLDLHDSGLRAAGVRKLTLYGHRSVCGGVQGSPEAFAPSSREAADHSTPYVMAMALLRARLTPREYEDAPWDTSEVKKVMSKIELVHESGRDEALDRDGVLGVRLVAELEDGRIQEMEVHQPKGHPDAPLSDADLLEKMTWLLEDVAPPNTASRIFDICGRLSSPEDVTALVEACRLPRD